MEINEQTAQSLGNKLAALDLSSEEALLLTAALGDASDDVTGYGGVPDTSGFENAAPNLMHFVQGPVNQRWEQGGASELWKSDGTPFWRPSRN